MPKLCNYNTAPHIFFCIAFIISTHNTHQAKAYADDSANVAQSNVTSISQHGSGNYSPQFMLRLSTVLAKIKKRRQCALLHKIFFSQNYRLARTAGEVFGDYATQGDSSIDMEIFPAERPPILGEHKIVIVTASYNNRDWYKRSRIVN